MDDSRRETRSRRTKNREQKKNPNRVKNDLQRTNMDDSRQSIGLLALNTFWLLQSSSNLPISTRTIEALTEVEAFALVAEDLKSVASQFRQLHHKHIQLTFRFYSAQWRTCTTCFVQAALRNLRLNDGLATKTPQRLALLPQKVVEYDFSVDRL